MAIAAAPPVDEITRGRGGFMRNAQGTPYVSDPTGATVKPKRKADPPRVKRVPYGAPSSRGKQIENTYNLQKWSERMVVTGLGRDLAAIVDCVAVAQLEPDSDEWRAAADRLVIRLKDAAQASIAADRGTHTHALSEDHDEERDWIARAEAGEDLGIDRDTQAALVDAWRRMLEREGLEILAVEASCVDDRWRLAGTLDRIARCTTSLRFVRHGGEIVEVPAGTVLVLDIKTGQRRTNLDGSAKYWHAYAVQIASYAQSVPYDTVTETRGVWPWEVSQEHALIAHLDVLGALEGKPVDELCQLVWVDLVAGREHGGETCALAKAWESRRDVFSIARAVEFASPEPDGSTGDAPTPAEGEHLIRDPLSIDSAGVEFAGIQPASDADTSAGIIGPPPPMVPALTPAEQHAQLATSPDEGPTADPAAIALLRTRYEQLGPNGKAWFRRGGEEAMQANVSFHMSRVKTVRRFELARGLTVLASTLDEETTP